MDSIKIFLVDDHRIFLEGLVKLIQDHPSMNIIGTARDGREALKEIRTLRPDVVLMDITMPNLNGLEATRLIMKSIPETKVLILTMHENEEFLRRTLEAGAVGYLLKDSTADELFLAIQEAYRGNCYLSPPVSRRLIADYLETRKSRLDQPSGVALTGREREILQLLAEGLPNPAIAKSLHLSLKTIETHRKKIMKKLNLHRITDLVRYAIRNKIIES